MDSSRSSPSRIPAPTLAVIVLAVMVGMYGIDKWLASVEATELRREAEDHFRSGQQFMRQGKPDRAVADFDRAHTMNRSNRQYSLALAEAQLASHDLTSARSTLDDLLDEDSNDGRANLLMARLLTEEGRPDAADSYYHRAIYGRWPPTAQSEPARIRLELARLLAQRDNRRELLSELLLIQSTSQQDPAVQKELPDLFLRAGSPQRAADAYRDILKENAGDTDAYLGLADTEVLRGDYRAAENAMMSALRKQPYNQEIQQKLRRVVSLASLDPTIRRLSTAEKNRRSAAILKMVQECVGAEPSSVKQSGPMTNESAEALIDQAEELWQQKGGKCDDVARHADVLPLLLQKLK